MDVRERGGLGARISNLDGFVNDYKNQAELLGRSFRTRDFLFSIWGFGTFRELEFLEEAGFSPPRNNSCGDGNMAEGAA